MDAKEAWARAALGGLILPLLMLVGMTRGAEPPSLTPLPPLHKWRGGEGVRSPVQLAGASGASGASAGVLPPAPSSEVPRATRLQPVERRAPTRPQPAVVNRHAGRPVEAAGGFRRHFIYHDTFEEPWFRQDATIDGYASVAWDREGATLRLEGGPRERRQVTLRYQFVSPFVLKEIVAELEGSLVGGPEDRIELAFSPDGERFFHGAQAFGREDGHAFHLTTEASARHHGQKVWVRVAADLGPGAVAALKSFRTVARCKHNEGCTAACLEPEGDGRLVYRDTFECPKVFIYAEIENPKALEWTRGRIAVTLPGDPAGARVALRQRIVSHVPLRGVTVRVGNTAAAARGAVNQFGLSLDGTTLLAQAATPPGGFQGTTELRLDVPPQLADARQVYLHVVLANQPGSAAGPSNVLSDLEVVGVPAASVPSARPVQVSAVPARR